MSVSQRFTENNAQEARKEWMSCQSTDTAKMVAITWMDSFTRRFGLTEFAATAEG